MTTGHRTPTRFSRIVDLLAGCPRGATWGLVREDGCGGIASALVPQVLPAVEDDRGWEVPACALGGFSTAFWHLAGDECFSTNVYGRRWP